MSADYTRRGFILDVEQDCFTVRILGETARDDLEACLDLGAVREEDRHLICAGRRLQWSETDDVIRLLDEEPFTAEERERARSNAAETARLLGFDLES